MVQQRIMMYNVGLQKKSLISQQSTAGGLSWYAISSAQGKNYSSYSEERSLTWVRVAISMRRPNMLRFNSWMNDCVLFLEDFPNVTMFDKRLVARVRLMNIAEEFASSLSLDDPDNKSIVLDSRTLRTMQAFERRLKSWKDSLDLDVMNGK